MELESDIAVAKVGGSFNRDIESQVAQFEDQLVLHPALKACEAQIETLHREAQYRKAVSAARRGAALGRPRGMLVTGLTGTGKSTLARLCEEKYPRVHLPDRTLVSVLRVELPSQPRANVIGEQLLIGLGDPLASARASGEFRLERAKQLIQACGTTLILIDEIQHVTDNLNQRECDVAADMLKNLMAVGVPVIFFGLPSACAYFMRNQQLSRRCTPKISLVPFGMSDEACRKTFKMLLKSLHSSLPMKGPSALVDPNCTLPLHFACAGLIGQLTQLVGRALRIALEREDTMLGREHLRLSFEQTIYPGCSSSRNPFDEQFSQRALVAPGEPYHGLFA